MLNIGSEAILQEVNVILVRSDDEGGNCGDAHREEKIADLFVAEQLRRLIYNAGLLSTPINVPALGGDGLTRRVIVNTQLQIS